MQSASYWQVLFWKLWKNGGETRKKAECLCKRTKGQAMFRWNSLLLKAPSTLLSLPLNWIDQQCRKYPIRKCLPDRGQSSIFLLKHLCGSQRLSTSTLNLVKEMQRFGAWNCWWCWSTSMDVTGCSHSSKMKATICFFGIKNCRDWLEFQIPSIYEMTFTLQNANIHCSVLILVSLSSMAECFRALSQGQIPSIFLLCVCAKTEWWLPVVLHVAKVRSSHK